MTKRHLLAISLGLLAILGIEIIVVIITITILKTIFFQEQEPSLILVILRTTLLYLSFLTGGFIVGWTIKSKGWLFGTLLGFIVSLILLGMTALPLLSFDLFYGPEYTSGYAKEVALKNTYNRINNQLLGTPKIILLTSLGGFLGTYIYKKRKRLDHATDRRPAP